MYSKIKILISILFCFACTNGNSVDIVYESKILDNTNIYVELCLNNKDHSFLKSCAIDDFTRQLNGIQVASNLNEIEAHLSIYNIAFPNLNIKIMQQSINENQVFIQWQLTGTNTGMYAEALPTGKNVNISGSSTLVFDKNGKLKEEIIYYNELDLLQQLGYVLIPPILE
jgi:hypothetical protein